MEFTRERWRKMRGKTIAISLALTLSTLFSFASGESFTDSSSHVSVTRVEDTPSLHVLDKLLECPTLYPEFYIGNEEAVPFEVLPDPTADFFVDLRFTRRPDAELGDEYYEVFVVCDDGNPSQPPATATVTVTVTSVNEYSPYAPHNSYSIAFSETARGGEVVGSTGVGPNQYYIADDDGGLDGRLTYTALNDPPNPYFTLSAETGDIILLSDLDYEKEGSLTSSVLIHGCDRVTPAIFCPNITVNLSLTPANDNDPHFQQSEYWVSVAEGLHRGTDLMAGITCTDDDIGEGSYAGIEVVSSTLDLIYILADSETGTATLLLTAVVDYDFTNNTEFEVRLRCYDSGEDVRSEYTTVHVEVLPTNDHSPEFTSEQFSTSVLESLPVDTSLLTAQCSDQDRDYGKLAAITLDNPSQRVNNTFYINPATGELTLTDTLDYDNPDTRVHIFTIRCSDEGDRAALSQITITTLPVSDEPLALESPVFQFAVDRLSTEIDSRVGQVIAIDGDQGEVAVIIYSLEYSDLFDIDDEGYIILTDYLTRDKGDFFNLTVEARDGQGAVQGQVEITVSSLLSPLGVISVVIGTFGLVVVAVIAALVVLCTYICWRLYCGRSEEDTTEVPVYMRGETLHTLHPQSAHSRSRSSGKGQRVFHTGALRERSTLSIQRAKKKKAGHNFKKRARQQPDVRQSFFINNNSNDAEDDQVLFGQSPKDMEMTIFRNEDAVRDTVDDWTKEEEAVADQSTHNIFNPEDAGLMLGDIVLSPGEEQTRWNKDESDSVVTMKSWALEPDDPITMGSEVESRGSESESGGTGEWDPAGLVEWEPARSTELDSSHDDTDSLTITTI